MRTILFIFGTRPEAIKMAPLVAEFKKNDKVFKTVVCVTAQHRQMLDQVLDFFAIKPDYDLNLMKPNQSLFSVTADGLKGLEPVLDDARPDVVFVQGDTTTVLVGALAAYYKKIDVAHLEAGLRSGNRYSPYPEEMNRMLTGRLSRFHFAPTEQARKNLEGEGMSENVWVVGNTVIDALLMGLAIIKKGEYEKKILDYFNLTIPGFQKLIGPGSKSRIILVTGHRRESFGGPFEDICHALKEILDRHKEAEIIYPVHLNPNVREPVNRILKDEKRVHLIEPLDYPYLIWLMEKSYLVLTDSGGIQEEAPTLGKPVLVMRDVTERMEGVEAGTAKLVGTNQKVIVEETAKLLESNDAYQQMAKAVNPYGDGTTSRKIVEILANYFR
jgi:UDP-N-acetylglucosamine 2-epimerase (non-hydrolysing)